MRVGFKIKRSTVLEDRSRQLNIKNNWRNSVVDLQLLHDGDPVRNIALYGPIMIALAKNQGDVPSSLVRVLSADV
jgi:hypothetical protein